LILIALSMCAWVLVWPLAFVGIGLEALRAFSYLAQALPIAGNLLCAFVPLKGVARTLALANLGVIALGLALTLVAGRMGQRAVDATLARNQEMMQKLSDGEKEEQELLERLTDLRRTAAKGNKDAAREERELSRKLSDLQKKRLAAVLKDTERMAREITSTSLAGSAGFWGWAHLHGTFLMETIHVIILSFFIRAIALALGDRSLAGSCPRVAALALLILIVLLLWTILPLGAVASVSRLLLPILSLLGMASYVWQGIQLVEACTLIGNHLNAKSA
jgi:hypothetical protein